MTRGRRPRPKSTTDRRAGRVGHREGQGLAPAVEALAPKYFGNDICQRERANTGSNKHQWIATAKLSRSPTPRRSGACSRWGAAVVLLASRHRRREPRLGALRLGRCGQPGEARLVTTGLAEVRMTITMREQR